MDLEEVEREDQAGARRGAGGGRRSLGVHWTPRCGLYRSKGRRGEKIEGKKGRKGRQEEVSSFTLTGSLPSK